jgi:6-methylsalicylate decarboxylase
MTADPLREGGDPTNWTVFTGARARFPEVRFILAHAGGTLPYLALRLELAPMIKASLQNVSREKIVAGLKSFWYDNAVASGDPTMGALSRVTVQEDILFGSDWPFCDDRLVTEEDPPAQYIQFPHAGCH